MIRHEAVRKNRKPIFVGGSLNLRSYRVDARVIDKAALAPMRGKTQ
jgi:hypothetical protein